MTQLPPPIQSTRGGCPLCSRRANGSQGSSLLGATGAITAGSQGRLFRGPGGQCTKWAAQPCMLLAALRSAGGRRPPSSLELLSNK